MSRRNPAGRQQQVVSAAVRAIAEVGVGHVTHRLIARLAAVPLGSTTYYFPTLDDLVGAALSEVADTARADIAGWQAALADSDDPPLTLVGLLRDYLADRSRAVLEYELYLAAARTPELQPAALVWRDGLRTLFADLVGPSAAAGLVAFVDGVLISVLVTDEALDADEVEAGVRRFFRLLEVRHEEERAKRRESNSTRAGRLRIGVRASGRP